MPDYSQPTEGRQSVTRAVENDLSNLSARLEDLNARLERVLIALLGPGSIPVAPLNKDASSSVVTPSGFFPEINSRINFLRSTVNSYETIVDIFTNEFPSEGR